MKRCMPLIAALLVILCLAGCAPGGYLNSTDGEIHVSLPEETTPEKPVFTEEQQALLGEWKLISITERNDIKTYTDASYTFEQDGRCTARMNGTVDKGSFYFKDDSLFIWGNLVTYTIEGDTLTITDAGNKVHLLTKVVPVE